MDIVFWPEEDPNPPVIKFMEKQDLKIQEGIKDEFARFERYGLESFLMSKQIKKFKGKEFKKLNLYEFRIKVKKTAIRILAHIQNNKCWLLHAFKKKSNHTPPKELAIGSKRCKILISSY